jgi:acetyltransferase-like isoleucine patch superfamily enzyme
MDNITLYGLIGAGGFGREVMPLVRAQLAPSLARGQAQVAFVVEGEPDAQMVNETPVISLDAFLNYSGSKRFNIAIGNSEARARIAAICGTAGVSPFTIMATNVVILENVQIGEGAILCPFVTLLSNARIGRFFHANIYSYVAHDCVIEDRVITANNVMLGGHVRVEHDATLSGGVAVHHFASIGCYAFVSGLSRVLQDVPPFMLAEGFPARPRCVNVVALKRKNFSTPAIRAIGETQNGNSRRPWTSSSGLSSRVELATSIRPFNTSEMLSPLNVTSRVSRL